MQRLQGLCALRFHTWTQSPNSNAYWGRFVLRMVGTRWKPSSGLLAFFCQFTFDGNLGTNIPLPWEKRKEKQSWIYSDASKLGFNREQETQHQSEHPFPSYGHCLALANCYHEGIWIQNHQTFYFLKLN